MIHSFTDEQLLNLVNNTIRTKTDYDISEFTGGSVQITSTNNHQLMKYKVSLFFGYKQKNPICRTIDINDGLVSIWMDAIQLKCKAMQVSNNGMDYSELNSLMNNLSKEVVSKEVEVVSISNGIEEGSKVCSNTTFSFSLSRETQFENLSKEYVTRLEEEIKSLNLGMSFEDFTMSLMAKGYKYKNFLLAYKTWCKRDNKPNQQKSKTLAERNREALDAYEKIYSGDIIEGVIE